MLPLSYTLIALRLAWLASDQRWGRALTAIGLVVGYVLGRQPMLLEGHSPWPWIGILFAAGALGAPIFTLLGGAAALLFMSDGITPAIIAVETYGLAVSPTLPAIPLFTLAGFLLAEGLASQRLLRVFRACLGWIPGGTAVVCAALCSFFTVFTGGSGVTILALGGLLFPALLKEGYRERFSLGLLTASGSLGLLLPPALPLILFGIVAEIPIEDLFIGGIVPGLLLTGLIAAWGVREGLGHRSRKKPFPARRSLGGGLGGQVGTGHAIRRLDRAVQRSRDTRGGLGTDRTLRADRASRHPPRPVTPEGCDPGRDRVRHARRWGPHHPGVSRSGSRATWSTHKSRCGSWHGRRTRSGRDSRSYWR